jgi:hypothetical protein
MMCDRVESNYAIALRYCPNCSHWSFQGLFLTQPLVFLIVGFWFLSVWAKRETVEVEILERSPYFYQPIKSLTDEAKEVAESGFSLGL